MFTNIGSKIKGYAQVIFVIMTIAGIIGAIAAGFSVGRFRGFLLFVLLCALAVVVSYLSVMFIYGFGELVENSTRIREMTDRLCDTTNNTYSEIHKHYSSDGSNPQANNEYKMKSFD